MTTTRTDCVGTYEIEYLNLFIMISPMVEKEWNLFVGKVLVGKLFERDGMFQHTHSTEKYKEWGHALSSFMIVLKADLY